MKAIFQRLKQALYFAECFIVGIIGIFIFLIGYPFWFIFDRIRDAIRTRKEQKLSQQ